MEAKNEVVNHHSAFLPELHSRAELPATSLAPLKSHPAVSTVLRMLG